MRNIGFTYLQEIRLSIQRDRKLEAQQRRILPFDAKASLATLKRSFTIDQYNQQDYFHVIDTRDVSDSSPNST